MRLITTQLLYTLSWSPLLMACCYDNGTLSWQHTIERMEGKKWERKRGRKGHYYAGGEGGTGENVLKKAGEGDIFCFVLTFFTVS